MFNSTPFPGSYVSTVGPMTLEHCVIRYAHTRDFVCWHPEKQLYTHTLPNLYFRSVSDAELFLQRYPPARNLVAVSMAELSEQQAQEKQAVAQQQEQQRREAKYQRDLRIRERQARERQAQVAINKKRQATIARKKAVQQAKKQLKLAQTIPVGLPRPVVLTAADRAFIQGLTTNTGHPRDFRPTQDAAALADIQYHGGRFHSAEW